MLPDRNRDHTPDRSGVPVCNEAPESYRGRFRTERSLGIMAARPLFPRCRTVGSSCACPSLSRVPCPRRVWPYRLRTADAYWLALSHSTRFRLEWAPTIQSLLPGPASIGRGTLTTGDHRAPGATGRPTRRTPSAPSQSRPGRPGVDRDRVASQHQSSHMPSDASGGEPPARLEVRLLGGVEIVLDVRRLRAFNALRLQRFLALMALRRDLEHRATSSGASSRPCRRVMTSRRSGLQLAR